MGKVFAVILKSSKIVSIEVLVDKALDGDIDCGGCKTRVLTDAIYECLVGVYKANTEKEAIIRAAKDNLGLSKESFYAYELKI